MSNFYETDRAVSEYLLFHYGAAEEILDHGVGPFDALDYPKRCVTELAPVSELQSAGRPLRGLDLGCAVGRSAFEMSVFMDEVIGIDFSHRFIEAAERVRNEESIQYGVRVEGRVDRQLEIRTKAEWNPERIKFLQGDAQDLPEEVSRLDLVLMANLIDRLPDPAAALEDIVTRINAGGYLIITSPYTWLEEYTSREKWLGGYETENGVQTTFEGLKLILEKNCDLTQRSNLPFLIREHSRKFQWSLAEGTVWKKR